MTSISHFTPQLAKFVSERLTEAREARGLNMTELGTLVGVTRQAISSYESGKSPSSEALAKLAETLNVPISYFAKAAIENPRSVGATFFRSFSSKTKTIQKALKVRSGWALELLALLERFMDLPHVNLPSLLDGWNADQLTDDQIEEMAALCRRVWGLRDGPLGNLSLLLENNGVVVVLSEFGDQKVDAYSSWYEHRPVVFLGTDKHSAVRSRFDAAHELGHLILHRGVTAEQLELPDNLKRIEREANRFASAFLMPATTFPKEVYGFRVQHFLNLKLRWKVSVAAMGQRCKQLGLMDDDEFLNFRKSLAAQKMLKQEPLDRDISFEEPKLIANGIRLLMDSKVVPASDLVHLIGLQPTEIEKLAMLQVGELTSRLEANLTPLTLKSPTHRANDNDEQ